MTYEEALASAKKVGASRAEGDPLLAQIIKALASVHAINPKLVYAGAIKQRLSAAQVRKLSGLALGDLMFA